VVYLLLALACGKGELPPPPDASTATRVDTDATAAADDTAVDDTAATTLADSDPPTTDTAPPQDSDSADSSCETDWPDVVTPLGAIPIDEDFPHLSDGLLIDDDLLMLAGQAVDFSRSVWTFDVSDPAAPTMIDSSGNNQLMSICWGGDRGFGVQLDGYLSTITVSASGRPTLNTLFQTGISAGRVDCDDQVVAWGTGASGGGWATVEDLLAGGPSAYQAIDGDVRDTVIEGDRLWALGYDALVAYDIDKTAGALTEVGRLALDGGCYDLERGDGWLAASCNSAGVALIDRNDGTPTLLGQWQGYVSARTSEAAGDTLLVAGWTDLLVLDVSDPTAPTLVGSQYRDNAIAASVYAGDDLLYVIDWKAPYAARLALGGGPEIRSLYTQAIPGDFALLYNDGTENLCLDAPTGGELVDTLVEPGGYTFWSIPGDAVFGDSFSVSTNDADEPTFTLAVGNVAGLSVGDEAPDFIEPDLDSVPWQLSELRGQIVFLGMMERS